MKKLLFTILILAIPSITSAQVLPSRNEVDSIDIIKMSGLNLVNKVRPVQFTLNDRLSWGFILEDMQSVNTNFNDVLSVSAINIKATQELSRMVGALMNENASLKERISKLEKLSK